MKLLLVFAFLAAASAAEIKVQPLVLPEAPTPEFYQGQDLEGIQNEETYDAVKIADDAAPVEDDTVYAVKVADVPINEESDAIHFAELPAQEEESAIPFFALPDISPLIVPKEIMRELREKSKDVADAFVDAVQVADAPAVQEINPFNFINVPESDFEVNVDAVRVADGPVDDAEAVPVQGAPETPFEDVQVDPVMIVDSAHYVMPMEYRRENFLPIYADPMLR